MDISADILNEDFPGGPAVKNPSVMQEMRVRSLGQDCPLEEGLVTHSSILAWRIPWTEPGRLQSQGSDTTEAAKHESDTIEATKHALRHTCTS